MNTHSYKDLIVWQKSLDLVHEIYKLTKQFPKSEVYALSSQMQRAAVSIPSNIAEGQSRNHKPEFIQFLHIAYGSSSELETQVLISKKEYPDLAYGDIEKDLDCVQKMLMGLIRSIKARN
jgi:four helix bundle protein